MLSKYPDLKITASIKILGLHFAFQEPRKTIWTKLTQKINNIIKQHESKNLTIYGKQININTLITPQLLATIRIYKMPANIQKTIERSISKFIGHPQSTEQIKRKILKLY